MLSQIWSTVTSKAGGAAGSAYDTATVVTNLSQTLKELAPILKKFKESNLFENVEHIAETAKNVLKQAEEKFPGVVEEVSSGRIFKASDMHILGLFLSLTTLYQNLSSPSSRPALVEAITEALEAIRRLTGVKTREARNNEATLEHLDRAINGTLRDRHDIREAPFCQDLLNRLDNLKEELVSYLALLEDKNNLIPNETRKNCRQKIGKLLLSQEEVPPAIETPLPLLNPKPNVEKIEKKLEKVKKDHPEECATLLTLLKENQVDAARLFAKRHAPLWAVLERNFIYRPPYSPIPVSQFDLPLALQLLESVVLTLQNEQDTAALASITASIALLKNLDGNAPLKDRETLINAAGKLAYSDERVWHWVKEGFIKKPTGPTFKEIGLLPLLRGIKEEQEGSLSRPLHALFTNAVETIKVAVARSLPDAVGARIDPTRRDVLLEDVDKPPPEEEPKGSFSSWFEAIYKSLTQRSFSPAIKPFCYEVHSQLGKIKLYLEEQNRTDPARFETNNNAVIKDITDCLTKLENAQKNTVHDAECKKILNDVRQVMNRHPIWIGGIGTLSFKNPIGLLTLLTLAKPLGIGEVQVATAPRETLDTVQKNLVRNAANCPNAPPRIDNYTVRVKDLVKDVAQIGAWKALFEGIYSFIGTLPADKAHRLPSNFGSLYQAARAKAHPGATANTPIHYDLIRPHMKTALKEMLSLSNRTFMKWIFQLFFPIIFKIAEYGITRFAYKTHEWIQTKVEKAKTSSLVTLKPLEGLREVAEVIRAAAEKFPEAARGHGNIVTFLRQFAGNDPSFLQNNKNYGAINEDVGKRSVDRFMIQFELTNFLETIDEKIHKWASSDFLMVRILLHTFSFPIRAALWLTNKLLILPVQGIGNGIIRGVTKLFLKKKGDSPDFISQMIHLTQQNLYGREQTRTANHVINGGLVDLLTILAEKIDAPPNENDDFFKFSISEEAKIAIQSTVKTLLMATHHRNEKVVNSEDAANSFKEVHDSITLPERVVRVFRPITGASPDDITSMLLETLLTRVYYLFLDSEMLNKQLYLAFSSIKESMVQANDQPRLSTEEETSLARGQRDRLALLLKKVLLKTVLLIKKPISDGLQKDQEITDSVNEIRSTFLGDVLPRRVGLIQSWRTHLLEIQLGQNRDPLPTLLQISKDLAKEQQNVFNRIAELKHRDDAGGASIHIHLEDLYDSFKILGEFQEKFFSIHSKYLEAHLHIGGNIATRPGERIQSALNQIGPKLDRIERFLLLEELHQDEAMNFEEIFAVVRTTKTLLSQLEEVLAPEENSISPPLRQHIENLKDFFTRIHNHLFVMQQRRSLKHLLQVVQDPFDFEFCRTGLDTICIRRDFETHLVQCADEASSANLEHILQAWKDLLNTAFPLPRLPENEEKYEEILKNIHRLNQAVREGRDQPKVRSLYTELKTSINQYVTPIRQVALDPTVVRIQELKQTNLAQIATRTETALRVRHQSEPLYAAPLRLLFTEASSKLTDLETAVNKIKAVASIEILLERMPFLGTIETGLVELLDDKVTELMKVYVQDPYVFEALVERLVVIPLLEELKKR